MLNAENRRYSHSRMLSNVNWSLWKKGWHLISSTPFLPNLCVLSVKKEQMRCLASFEISTSSGNVREFLWSIIFPYVPTREAAKKGASPVKNDTISCISQLPQTYTEIWKYSKKKEVTYHTTSRRGRLLQTTSRILSRTHPPHSPTATPPDWCSQASPRLCRIAPSHPDKAQIIS